MSFQNILICGLVLVTLASCHQGSSKNGANNSAPVDVEVAESKYVQLEESAIITECEVEEKEKLKVFENLLLTADEEIKAAQKVAASVKAQQMCQDLIEHLGDAGACRIVKKDRIRPDAPPKITYYDQYRVDQKCQKTEKYLISKDALPGKDDTSAPTPGPTQSPVVIRQPTPTPTPTPVQPGSSRKCTDAEFNDNLLPSMKALDEVNVKIDALGAEANWKYNSNLIMSVSASTKSCENLIAYHDQQPCQRVIGGVTKEYSGKSLRQRCEKVRTYFYEFVQNKKTLNFKNADLFLDISSFSDKTFEAEYINDIQGCRVENKSGRAIDYSGRGLVLVKDSRGFEAKMMVLETNEGLLVQCYGLNIGDAFSKREIVRVLKEEGTNMPLVYKLK